VRNFGDKLVLLKELNLINEKMKTKKIVVDDRPKYKIQLDSRTTITVRTMNALNAWKERYPEAKVIE